MMGGTGGERSSERDEIGLGGFSGEKGRARDGWWMLEGFWRVVVRDVRTGGLFVGAACHQAETGRIGRP